MDSLQNIESALAHAVEHERRLWASVRRKLPGDPDCPESAWQEWLKAAELVRVLAEERARLMIPPKIR